MLHLWPSDGLNLLTIRLSMILVLDYQTIYDSKTNIIGQLMNKIAPIFLRMLFS